MKQKKSAFAAKMLLMVLVGCLLFLYVFGSPVVLWNNLRLKQKIHSAAGETVVLHQLTPFHWDEVYTFSPYTSKEEIARCIGFSSPSIRETVSEGMTQLLFVYKNRVVSSVCAHPSGVGYGVSGLPCGQGIPNRPDAPRFHLEKRGTIIWLKYLP